jgi:rhodanese-related sulfurtransferase
MKKILFLFLIFNIVILFAGCESKEELVCFTNEVIVNNECVEAFDNINNEELEALLLSPEDYQFVDVRTSNEYNTSKIPGFDINIDYYLFDGNHKMITHLDKNKPVVILCNSGNRSISASKIFFEEGFTEIYNVTFGIKGWTGETE